MNPDNPAFPMHPDYIVAMTAMGVVTFIGIVALPLFLVLRHAWRCRELAHAERMAALQMGLAPGQPRAEAAWSPAKVCVAIGAKVPITTFVFGLIAMMFEPRSSEGIWAGVAGVSVTAVICGTILALKLPLSRWEPKDHTVKPPPYDPEAFDALVRRG